MGHITSAVKLKCLILDVEEEIREAKQYHLNKVAVSYDMVYIIEEQDKTI